MVARKYMEYTEAALQPFAEQLQSDYYDTTEALCIKASKQAEKIKTIEKSPTQLQYVLQCERIIKDIEKHMRERKLTYMPYISTLSEKVKDNHNCTNCSGNCKINHDVHVLELNVTNEELKKVMSRLHMITLPLYSETIFPDEYRLLRSNMALLETSVTELFFLENNYLIPKIIEAQKKINAGNK